MKQDVLLEVTSDGSHTFYVPSIDEHYHSVNGAVQESMHVYIEAGFRNISSEQINVLEIGFGTGLNAYLTYKAAKKSSKKIHYTSFELYPLDIEVVSKLNYADSDKGVFEKLHESEWNTPSEIDTFFVIEKLKEDFSRLPDVLARSFDLIYFDAFAPDKQPEMWTQDIFDFLYSHTNRGGILTTYCAKGVVRCMMQNAGYVVERIPGPPGKREMLRAKKL